MKGVGPPDPQGRNLSDSVIRLHIERTGANGVGISMQPADWFTPYRKTWLDLTDLDLASAGVLLVPNSPYLFAGGKEGMLYVLARDHMGRFDDSTAFDSASVNGHFSDDPIGRDDPRRDNLVQKLRVGVNQYCAARPAESFCLGDNQSYPPGVPPPGVTMSDWIAWPHIHGTPVFGTFGNGRAFVYIWPEKDFLKSYRWWGRRMGPEPLLATKLGSTQRVMAPPYLRGVPGAVGMPGGFLALTIDAAQPAAGVLFASVQRCRAFNNDAALHECSVSLCETAANCSQQRFGMLRAFDPITMQEIQGFQ